jgi:NAD(P)-dependent dehydrogenase (short-subunit alcohol dehydrogenase family)
MNNVRPDPICPPAGEAPGRRILVVGGGQRTFDASTDPGRQRPRHVVVASCIPFGRMATGWEVAYAALFFVSDESVYVNAQTLAVDSGITGL